MKRALLAATALVASTIVSVTTPAFAARPVPPAPTVLDQYCADNAPIPLPNNMWFWDGVLGDIVDSGSSGGTLLGFTINPANRTIHALVEFDLDSVTYELTCNAMEPGAIRGNAPPNPHFSYITEITDETGGGGTEVGRPAVCNPAPTKGSGFPTSWKTPAGTAIWLEEGDTNCTELAAKAQAGELEPWH